MNTITIVTVADLKHAADEVEHDIATMEALGYPAVRNRQLPHLLRCAALELEVLKAECWRLSQGSTRS